MLLITLALYSIAQDLFHAEMRHRPVVEQVVLLRALLDAWALWQRPAVYKGWSVFG